MDYAKGNSDPEAKEATAHVISLTRAYQNLGAILATEAECQTSFSIKSLGAVIGKVHTELCNFFASLYDNLFSCGNLTTMVHRDSRTKASDTSQCSWVDLEFQEMTYIFQANVSIENSFVEVGSSSNWYVSLFDVDRVDLRACRYAGYNLTKVLIMTTPKVV